MAYFLSEIAPKKSKITAATRSWYSDDLISQALTLPERICRPFLDPEFSLKRRGMVIRSPHHGHPGAIGRPHRLLNPEKLASGACPSPPLEERAGERRLFSLELEFLHSFWPITFFSNYLLAMMVPLVNVTLQAKLLQSVEFGTLALGVQAAVS